MKSDRVCWIDSSTIKRGRVLMLDGSLVPFCSKCLDACMRANDVSKRFEKAFKTCADCLRPDSPAQRGGQSAILIEKYTREVLVSGRLDFYRADDPHL